MNRDQFIAVDTAGQVLAVVDPGYAAKAIARREAVRTDRPHVIRLARAIPINELSPEAKRRQYLAQHRR